MCGAWKLKGFKVVVLSVRTKPYFGGHKVLIILVILPITCDLNEKSLE